MLHHAEVGRIDAIDDTASQNRESPHYAFQTYHGRGCASRPGPPGMIPPGKALIEEYPADLWSSRKERMPDGTGRLYSSARLSEQPE